MSRIRLSERIKFLEIELMWAIHDKSPDARIRHLTAQLVELKNISGGTAWTPCINLQQARRLVSWVE